MEQFGGQMYYLHICFLFLFPPENYFLVVSCLGNALIYVVHGLVYSPLFGDAVKDILRAPPL